LSNSPLRPDPISFDAVAVCQGLKKVEQSLRENKNLGGVMTTLENNLTKNKKRKKKLS
jgi:hypothetical protein